MTERISHAEMAFELTKQIYSKTCWLADIGTKRPQHEIDIKRRELAVLRQAQSDYENAAKRPGVKNAENERERS